MLGDRRKKSRPRAAMAMAGGLVALVLGAVPAQAATINVTTTADENGTGPACSLREAIQAANTDMAFGGCPAGSPGADTINAPGTFPLLLGELVVNSTITINNATVTRAAEAPDFRIFRVDSGGDLTLERVTVTGGLASCSGDPCFAQGGGIANFGTLTLRTSRVTGNTAFCSGDFCFALGGGIANFGTLTVTSSTVTGNTASCLGNDCSALGGGIFNSGDTTVTSSSSSNNTASCSGDFCQALGGGIVNNVNLTLTSSRSSNNTASCSGSCVARGGGLFNGGTATLTGSAVTGNRAVGATAEGGGIFVADGTVTLNSTAVSGNTPNNCRPVGSVPGCNN